MPGGEFVERNAKRIERFYKSETVLDHVLIALRFLLFGKRWCQKFYEKKGLIEKNVYEV